MPPLSLDPHTAFAQGAEALLAGDLRAAKALLLRATELAPYFAPARHDLALVLRLEGRLVEALAQTRDALALAPELAAAHRQRAVLWLLAGDASQASEALAQALALEPRDPVGVYYAGVLALREGRYDEALAALDEALRTGAALPRLLYERVRTQRDELARAHVAGASAERERVTAVCSVPLVSEVLVPAGGALERRFAGFVPATSASAALAPRASEPARTVTPDEVAEALHRARSVAVVTGAGVSAESGLATRKELWQRFDRDNAVAATRVRVLLPVLWVVVRDFLGDLSYAPNPAHMALARLPRLQGIYTQNVDDLHQRAAPEGYAYPIVELHGTLERTRCSECGAPGPSAPKLLAQGATLPPGCAACGARQSLRPDVVLFGEWVAPAHLEAAARAALTCDVLLLVGCAMDVSPASELPALARAAGATVIECKRTPSRLTSLLGTWHLPGPAAQTLPAVYEALARREPLPPLPSAPVRARGAPRGAPSRNLVVEPLPKLGESVVEATINRWLVKPGDRVERDQPLVEVDTDKVSFEVPATTSGVFVSALVDEGATLPVLGSLAVLEADPPGLSRSRVLPVSAATLRPEPSQLPPEAPLLTHLGKHTAQVRPLLEALCTARWLEPDTELQAPGAEAKRWLEERVDEFVAALAAGAPEREPPRFALRVTHEAHEARAWFREAWRCEPFELLTAWAPPLDGAAAWLDALAALLRPIDQREGRWTRDEPSPSGLLAALQAARAPHRASEPALPTVKGRPPLTAPELLAYYALAWRGYYGLDEARPCPARPWLALWQRGAWPFALPDAVCVFVPPEPYAKPTTRLEARGKPALASYLFPWLLPPLAH